MSDLRANLQTTLGSAYRIEREIAGGGMSRVFVAEEMALGRRVVVKVLPPELSATVRVDRFKREIQVAARLQHAHIVPLIGAGEMNGLPFYTMPYVEGESLRTRIGRVGRLSVAEAISILRDVSKALAYAHERGIVHRDIKPDNVMIAGGSAMVLDFGIAKAIAAARADTPGEGGEITKVGTSIGTPMYMAPEQARGDPATDHRADLYSLGCMAYEVLCGRPPFMAASSIDLMVAQILTTPQPVGELRPDVPSAIAAFVMRCLEKDPDDRPGSATDLLQLLESVTSGGGYSSVSPPPIGGPGSFRRALLLYAAGVVAVGLLAQAAVVAIGLPSWVFSGALLVMGLGLPLILLTGFVQRATRRALMATLPLTAGESRNVQKGGVPQLVLEAGRHLTWRRTVIAGAFALGAFVFLTGSFMALRALGIGPAGSLLAAGKLRSREPLLVTDFRVTNADSSLGRVLSDAAKSQIGLSRVLTLPSPEAVAGALRRMQRPVTSTLTLPVARELAMRNGIKAIVDGEITGLGTAGFIVTMKLVTADSAKELASFRRSAKDPQGLIDAVDRLARDLRGRAGESLRQVRAAPRLSVATTASLDALRKYTQGERAENIEGNRPAAIALLREAVAIDTGFAEAWRKLGMVLSAGAYPRAQIDSALERAYQLRLRVPENTRDWIIASYYGTGPGRDRAKAAAAYESLLRSGDTVGAANNLATILGSRREFARAESLYLADERLNPGGFRTRRLNIAIAQRRLAKFAAAESTEVATLRLFPDLKGAIARTRTLALYSKGDTAAFRRAVDSMLVNGDSAAKAWARPRVTSLAALDGRFRQWRALTNADRPTGSAVTPRNRLAWAIAPSETWVLAYALGQPDSLAKRLDAALAGYRGALTPAELEGIVDAYALAGRPAQARAYFARWDALGDTAQRRRQAPTRARLLGEILLAEGKGLEAVAAFREADRLPDGPVSNCVICLSMNLSRAFDRAGAADSAMKYYAHFAETYQLDRFSGGYDPYVLPAYLRRLGELHEQQGNPELAVRYFRRFVELWKNADSELQPRVAEARRALSRLAGIEGTH